MSIEATSDKNRRAWQLVGALFLGYVVLSFVGVSLMPSVLLGDSPANVTKALVTSSMTKAFAGGYIEVIGELLFLVGGLLLARLLRGASALGEWATWCIAAAVALEVVMWIGICGAAGAAALYDGHHGASLGTITAVDDVRNIGFALSGVFAAVFAGAVSAAVLATGRLARWVAWSGMALALLYLATTPLAGRGPAMAASMLGFVWIVGVALTSLRESRRTGLQGAAGAPLPASA
jgi:hypothetical protein